MRLVFAPGTAQFLHRLRQFGPLFAAAINGNADPETQHVVVAELLGGVLPHVLHIEIGIEIFPSQLHLQALPQHDLLLPSNLRVLGTDHTQEFVYRVAERGLCQRFRSDVRLRRRAVQELLELSLKTGMFLMVHRCFA